MFGTAINSCQRNYILGLGSISERLFRESESERHSIIIGVIRIHPVEDDSVGMLGFKTHGRHEDSRLAAIADNGEIRVAVGGRQ